MLEEIKKALSDFSSGFAQAMSQSINSIRSLLASLFNRRKEETDKEKDTSPKGDASFHSGHSGSDKIKSMEKLFDNNSISPEDVLKNVHSRSQQIQMSGPLAQTQKLVNSAQKAPEAEEPQQSATKKIEPKPPGF